MVKTETKTTEEVKEQTLADLLAEAEGEASDIMPEAQARKLLEEVDLTLPLEYQLEILADELVGTLGTYQRAQFGRRAARNLGDDPRATQMLKLERYSRLVAALIISEHPGVKAVADDMAQARATISKRQRRQTLGEDDD